MSNRDSTGTTSKRSGRIRPLSETRPSSAGCLGLFFAIFLLFGGVFFHFFFVRPALQWWAARSWQATDCIIVSSGVGSSSDGDTYRVEATFRYVYAGREYTSSRYEFMDAYTSGRDGKARVVARLAPGTGATCYVDPEKPAQAVLNRDLNAWYLMGLVPLTFVAIGVGGLIFVLRSGRRTKVKVPTSSWRPEPTPDLRASTAGHVVLRPGTSPVARFVGVCLIAAFWNGVVSVFVYQVVGDWRQGHGEWLPTLFLVPFVLVGLAAIGGCGYYLLALANPRPRLALQRSGARPGETVELTWQLRGAAHRIRNLRILLEGREEASYTRGTDHVTDRNVFCQVPIVDTQPHYLRGEQRVSFTVPPDTMHSFAARHNKVVWQLKVQGEIPRWPDVDESFDFEVLPAALSGESP